MSNLQLDEMQEELADMQLASTLGISLDDLYQLGWNIDANESSDGLIYEFIIEFSEGCPKDVLDKIEGFEEGLTIRVPPWEFHEESYDSEIEWEIASSEQLKIIGSHLDSVEKLICFNLDEKTQFSLLVMLHAHVVAAIESFLSSVFIHEVTNSDKLTRKLIETTLEFGKRKFTLKEIYEENEKLKITVARYLKSLIFHKIKNIKPMYKCVFEFDFGDISWLMEAIECRHDCVHRAGYNKSDEKVNVTVESVRKLMNKCRVLSVEISSHVIGNRLILE
ncbi:MAG: hypothetical protein COB94_009470 [Gammaproteobacteria bacterium]|nr:hypothetical protein [Gammaproteobacteria bacterium]